MTDDKRLCQPAGDLSLKRRGKISERSFAYIIAGRTMTAKFSRPYRLARGKSWGASASQEKRSAPKP